MSKVRRAPSVALVATNIPGVLTEAAADSGGYQPDRLVRGLAASLPADDHGAGRRRLLSRLPEPGPASGTSAAPDGAALRRSTRLDGRQ